MPGLICGCLLNTLMFHACQLQGVVCCLPHLALKFGSCYTACCTHGQALHTSSIFVALTVAMVTITTMRLWLGTGFLNKVYCVVAEWVGLFDSGFGSVLIRTSRLSKSNFRGSYKGCTNLGCIRVTWEHLAVW